MSEQRLLTVREVAERIRSSPETVRRWLRQGKLRGFRPGGTKLGYRVPESELQRFLEMQLRPGEADQARPSPHDTQGGTS
jgi:excisionase family DNA binding protein